MIVYLGTIMDVRGEQQGYQGYLILPDLVFDFQPQPASLLHVASVDEAGMAIPTTAYTGDLQARLTVLNDDRQAVQRENNQKRAIISFKEDPGSHQTPHTRIRRSKYPAPNCTPA